MASVRFLLFLLRCAAQAWLGVRSSLAYARLPVVPLSTSSGPRTGGSPLVSVIVPARNEARTLPVLLPSLQRQTYPRCEVMVVDDGSTDGTAAVAAAYGVRVVPAGPPPPGWVGKPHACATGADAARGEWLLFCDADTELRPRCIAAACAFAEEGGLESLSLIPRMRCVTLWERMLLPYVFQHFYAGVDAGAVNDPRRREALLNGQFLLIARDAYRRAGGHAAVRDSVVEDVALGRRLKAVGVRHAIARGEALVSVRMYTGLGAIAAGFSKNSTRFLADEPRRGALVLASTLLAAAPSFRLLGAAVRRGRGGGAIGGVAVPYAIAVASLVPWQRRFGAGVWLALFQPATALLFQSIALAGLWSAVVPRQTWWKGRRY